MLPDGQGKGYINAGIVVPRPPSKLALFAAIPPVRDSASAKHGPNLWQNNVLPEAR